jgi:predicted nucleotide-binding protein
MMQDSILEQIDNLVAESTEFTNDWQIQRWSNKVAIFLKTTLGKAQSEEFLSLRDENDWAEFAMRQGLLQGLAARARDNSSKDFARKSQTNYQENISQSIESRGTKKVFVVHGHDEAAKEATARFLEKLDLDPIILHEQASGGRTIIEKFEKYSSDVGFAVVLLTPDDLGASQTESAELHPRARQNVVLELGYFLGKLTRNRVCALYRGGIELPSDIQGVIYVEMDDAGAWKAKLAWISTEQKRVTRKTPHNKPGGQVERSLASLC